MSALLVGLIITYVVGLVAAVVLLPRDVLEHDFDQIRRVQAGLMRAIRRIPVPAPRVPRLAGVAPTEPPPEQPAAVQEPPAEEPPAEEPAAEEKPTNGAAVPAVSPPINGAALPSRLPRRPVGGSPILQGAPDPDAGGGDDAPPPGQRSNASMLVGFTSGSRRRSTAESPKS